MNAIDIHTCVIAFLRSHQLDRWVDGFQQILTALDESKLNQAIDLNKTIPRGGMGSLSDIFMEPKSGEDANKLQSSLMYLIGSQGRSIDRIRVFMTYNLDHPLIDLDLDNLDAATRVKLLQQLQ